MDCLFTHLSKTSLLTNGPRRQRYTGDEDQSANSEAGKETRADQILRRLHEEAELRRKAKQGEDAGKKRQQENDESHSATKAKKQKQERIVENINVLNDNRDKPDEDAGPVSEGGDEVKKSQPEAVESASEPTGFTILGEFRSKKLEKVHRTLPAWLANPSVVSSDIKNDRVRLRNVIGLDDLSIKLLRKNGIKRLFPVQAQVIPSLLSGAGACRHLSGGTGHRPSDICCSAPTGSGKTLAYVVPIVQLLRSRVVCRVRCLVVVPVGDLASQVHRVFTEFCQQTQLRIGLLTGLKPFTQEQTTIVRRGPRGFQSLVDIVVCTPGRLVDHINKTNGFDLTHLRFLVIDEADRMMEEIKQDWLALVDKAVYQDGCLESDSSVYLQPTGSRSLPRSLNVTSLSRNQIPLQKLLFSATLSQDPEKLFQLRLFQPVLFTSTVKQRPTVGSRFSVAADTHETPNGDIQKGVKTKLVNKLKDGEDFVGKFTTPVGLEEKFVECSKPQKPLTLLYILRQLNFKRVLCFTNSVTSTHRLYHLMKLVGGLQVSEFSSSLQAVRRCRILKQFAAGKIQLLISSDAMSRGIDVSDIDCVVSYDVPRVFATYVHRVGRTARAGRHGTGFTLLERHEIFHFKKLLSAAGKSDVKELKLKSSDLKPFIGPLKKALNQLPATLQAELRKTKGNKQQQQ